MKPTSVAVLTVTPAKLQQTVPHHQNIPFTREVYVGEEALDVDGLHIAVHHVVNAENQRHPYAVVHSHDVDEINLLIGTQRGRPLKYRIVANGEERVVDAPCSLLIPAGVEHSATAVAGDGLFVCIVRKAGL